METKQKQRPHRMQEAQGRHLCRLRSLLSKNQFEGCYVTSEEDYFMIVVRPYTYPQDLPKITSVQGPYWK